MDDDMLDPAGCTCGCLALILNAAVILIVAGLAWSAVRWAWS